MALAGQAAMIVWNDVEPENRPSFYEWHNREHMPERVAIPGFNLGRRYRAIHGSPNFCGFYEVENFAVLTSELYNERLNNPTPATRTNAKNVVNAHRALAHVRFSVGEGIGGFLLTLRFDMTPFGRDKALPALKDALAAVAISPEIVGAHLLEADKQASKLVTEEKKDRPPLIVPAWMVLVEGISREALDRAADVYLSAETLESLGAIGPYARGVYVLENIATSNEREVNDAG